MDSFLSNMKSSGVVHFERFSNISFPVRCFERENFPTLLGTAPLVFCQAPNASFKLVGQHVTWFRSNDCQVIMDDPTQRKCIKMWNVRPFAVFCCHFLCKQFLRIAILALQFGSWVEGHVESKACWADVAGCKFQACFVFIWWTPLTTTSWWWWWWWIWRISLVLMAIPEVICFGVVTQDLSYNYICRRWTPNWGCPCRKQMFCFRKRWRKQLKPHALWTWAVYLGRRKAHWEDVGFRSCPTIRKNIREKQTRAAWLINFKHHHVEFWISAPGQKNQEFVRVKSFLKMASGLRRVV